MKRLVSQFLLEALVISAAGGLIGLFVGVSGALLTNALTAMVIAISGSSIRSKACAISHATRYNPRVAITTRAIACPFTRSAPSARNSTRRAGSPPTPP